MLGYRVHTIADLKISQRNEILNAFQFDLSEVLLMSQAGGEGTNIIAANAVVLLVCDFIQRNSWLHLSDIF